MNTAQPQPSIHFVMKPSKEEVWVSTAPTSTAVLTQFHLLSPSSGY